jgi:hypothetical protein
MDATTGEIYSKIIASQINFVYLRSAFPAGKQKLKKSLNLFV